MAIGSSRQLFFFYLVLPFLATLTFAATDPYFQARCINTAGNYTANSTYQTNLNRIFSQLNSLTEFNYGFYNLSAGENPNEVNAIALCRGDRNKDECDSCLNDTISELRQRCPFYKEVVGWSEFCTVRFANREIFGEMEDSPGSCLLNTQDVTNADQFNQALDVLLNNLSSRAAAEGPLRKYAADKSSVSVFQTVYALVQCSPDLSEKDCGDCLTLAKGGTGGCCLGKMGCRVLRPSCFLRFESSQFYQTPIPLPSPPPSPTSSPPSIRGCSQKFNYTPFSQFQYNLDLLLIRQLYGKGSLNGFFNDTVGENTDKVYGLFLCRGDVQLNHCEACINEATTEIIKRCPGNKEAIIWYDACLVRYSYRNFFSNMELSPSIYLYNTTNITDIDKFEKNLAETFDYLTTMLSNVSNHLYATKEVNFSSSMSLYGLVQCTPDLSVADCQSCIRSAVAELPSFSSGKQGARVLKPSCNIRYEVYPFYGKPTEIIKNPGVESDAPLPSVNKTSGTGEGSKQGESKWIPIAASLSAIFGLTLFCSGGVFLWRRRNFQENTDHNSQEVQLLELGGGVGNDYSNENFQGESGARSQQFPSIQLDVLQAATKQFSDENKLGEGGFGPVYKGKLSDGKEIAVKRLSRTSGQGLPEFKNEVMLIARLQHRNLVRLLGCCLEQNEKLLVYEYMPNKSLDVFLFDSNIGVKLDWQKRLSIINGIARGILYLHEDSRLRIIHRDLKASNVLLDHEMNPKISDFGMARILCGKQSEANTNKVVGTYGYMAPEYAMEGLFSVKSDVFSFGVLLLELISGKRNSGFHLWERGESLLTFAWKLWSKGQGMELIDPLLNQSFVATEVVKCVHIGLLCVQEDPADRPTMSSVIVMLGSETITIPLPAEPAFSVGRFVAEPTQSTSNDRVCSVNEVTISNMSPR